MKKNDRSQMKGLDMVHKHSRRSILSFVVLSSVVATGLLGCAGKNHDSFKEPSVRGFKSSKELHLQQQAKSASADTPKTVPDMTAQEHERLGDINFRRGDLGTAFAQYTKALVLDPKNTELLYKKGLLLVIGKMNEDAVAEFEQALKLDPKHARAYEGLGLAYFQMKKHEQAKSNFETAIKLDAKLWKAHNFLGIIHDYQGNYKAAAIEYEAAIALTDKAAFLYNNLAVSFSLAGDYDKAIDAFNRALSLGQKDSRTYNNLGLALSNQGKYREALEAFRKGGDEAQAHNNLGCAYLKNGQYEKAIESFQEAVKLRPTFYTNANENLRKAKFGYETFIDQIAPPAKEEAKLDEEKIVVSSQTHSIDERAMTDQNSPPPLEPRYGLATVLKNSTLREAPDATAKEISWLPPGQTVVTVGKVVDKSWVLIAKDGKPWGYIHEALLGPADIPDSQATSEAVSPEKTGTQQTLSGYADFDQKLQFLTESSD